MIRTRKTPRPSKCLTPPSGCRPLKTRWLKKRSGSEVPRSTFRNILKSYSWSFSSSTRNRFTITSTRTRTINIEYRSGASLAQRRRLRRVSRCLFLSIKMISTQRLSTGRIPYFDIQYSIFCIRYSKILCQKRSEEITGSIKPAFRAYDLVRGPCPSHTPS